MSNNTIRTVFIDTSSLRRAGFDDPDLRKLLLLAKDSKLRVAVAHIAWEEWRTQFSDKAVSKVRKIRDGFDALKAEHPSNFILSRLRAPALALWDEGEIDAESKSAFNEFAAENRIEILPIGRDHSDRAWRRYFKIERPFRPEVPDRENRRKDIPDSWIYEAAIDLLSEDRDLAALCHDDNLANALAELGVKVFREPRHFVAALEEASAPRSDTGATQEAVSVNGAVATALSQALDPLRDHERRALGFVAHLGNATKQSLLGALAQVGTATTIAQNVLDRLVITGMIRDTGNHYLLSDPALATVAIEAVEEDIIKLLAASS